MSAKRKTNGLERFELRVDHQIITGKERLIGGRGEAHGEGEKRKISDWQIV